MAARKTINERRVLSLKAARAKDAVRAAEIQELRDAVVGVVAIQQTRSNSVQSGFEYAAVSARMRAQAGDIHGMLRQLSAAHALAVWACPALLDRYQALEAECWEEYWQWKTTTAG